MARTLLHYILQAYLFANGRQIVSLRWLALFRDFEGGGEANWGQACLAYLYSRLDTLSRWTLCQLVEPWKLLQVSFFPFSFVALVHAKKNCNSCFCKLSSYSLLSCKLSSCKLYPSCTLYSCKLYSSYTLYSCKLYSSCTLYSCKLYSPCILCTCKLYLSLPFFLSVGSFDMVLSFKGWTYVLGIQLQ